MKEITGLAGLYTTRQITRGGGGGDPVLRRRKATISKLEAGFADAKAGNSPKKFAFVTKMSDGTFEVRLFAGTKVLDMWSREAHVIAADKIDAYVTALKAAIQRGDLDDQLAQAAKQAKASKSKAA